MMRYQTAVVRPSIVAGTLGCMLVSAWRGVTPRAEDMRACSAVLLQRAKALGRCGLLVVIHPDMPLPDDQVRQTILEEVRKLDPYILCGATIISRGGLAGTALRAVVSTLQLLTRTKHPERIFAAIPEAARFLHSELSSKVEQSPSVEEIVAAYGELTTQAWSPA